MSTSKIFDVNFLTPTVLMCAPEVRCQAGSLGLLVDLRQHCEMQSSNQRLVPKGGPPSTNSMGIMSEMVYFRSDLYWALGLGRGPGVVMYRLMQELVTGMWSHPLRGLNSVSNIFREEWKKYLRKEGCGTFVLRVRGTRAPGTPGSSSTFMMHPHVVPQQTRAALCTRWTGPFLSHGGAGP